MHTESLTATVPDEHTTQLVEPDSDAIAPMAQLLHTEELATEENWPRGHARHAVELNDLE